MEQMAFGKLTYLLTNSKEYQILVGYIISSYGCGKNYLSHHREVQQYISVLLLILFPGAFLVNPLSIDAVQFTTHGHFKFQVKN